MENWDAKLTDFGLARYVVPQNVETMSKLCGTYSYAGIKFLFLFYEIFFFYQFFYQYFFFLKIC